MLLKKENGCYNLCVLVQTIENQPRLAWIKGFRAVALNLAGHINEFEDYASEVFKLPVRQKRRLGILCMQNVNDYLAGRQLRNSEEVILYYVKSKKSTYAPLSVCVVILCYLTGYDEKAFRCATNMLNKWTCLLYKSLAASILASIHYKYQENDEAREKAKIALAYAPSDKVRELLKNLHKNVLEQVQVTNTQFPASRLAAF